MKIFSMFILVIFIFGIPIYAQQTKNDMKTNQVKNKEAIRFLYEEIFNKRNFDLLRNIISEDYTNPKGVKGIEGFQPSIDEFIKAFPDVKWEIVEMIAEGDKVVVKQKAVGTQKEEFQNILPTLKTVTVNGIGIYEFKDEKIIGHQIQTDRFAFLQELEILPKNPTNKINGNAVFFVDKFIVPIDAVKEFSERMSYNRNFIKQLSGFIKDQIFESENEDGSLTVLTIAEWETADFLEKAKIAVQSEYQRIGFNPQGFYQKLHIKIDRKIYKTANLEARK